MSEKVIPDDVKDFILRHIHSIAQLECLLLLRASPQTKWSANSVAKSLYIDEQKADSLLKQLLAQNFFIASDNVPPFYQYQPATTELDNMIGRVAELYAKYLVPVTHLIHSESKNRIQEFADAFRIRKD